MLILSRYRDESVIVTTVEGRIEITIMSVRGDKVRLGFVAPKSVTVHRKEIQQRIDKAKGVTNGVKSNMSSEAH